MLSVLLHSMHLWRIYLEHWFHRAKYEKKYEHKLRPKTFWWNGPIYSHLAPPGQASNKDWYLWTDLKAWAKKANKSMVVNGPRYIGSNFSPERGFMTYSVDHLELFLPMKADITKKYH